MLKTLDAIRALRGKGNKAQGIPKVHRDAFIYLPSTDPSFAQCSSCASNKDGHCTTLNIPIEPHWTCGMYLQGSYSGQKSKAYMTAEQAGLLKTAPRCENCFYLEGTTCELFVKLNKALPDDFDLEERVQPKACCNAFVRR